MAKRTNFGINEFEQITKASKISVSDDIDYPKIKELINQEGEETSQEDNSNKVLRKPYYL